MHCVLPVPSGDAPIKGWIVQLLLFAQWCVAFGPRVPLGLLGLSFLLPARIAVSSKARPATVSGPRGAVKEKKREQSRVTDEDTKETGQPVARLSAAAVASSSSFRLLYIEQPLRQDGGAICLYRTAEFLFYSPALCNVFLVQRSPAVTFTISILSYSAFSPGFPSALFRRPYMGLTLVRARERELPVSLFFLFTRNVRCGAAVFFSLGGSPAVVVFVESRTLRLAMRTQ